MTDKEIITYLKNRKNDRNIAGMKRFGIRGKIMLGIPIPVLRSLAKKTGRDHLLALTLWKTGIHEARILASMIDDPLVVTEKQMDSWIKDIDSWDVCDQVCGNLFCKTKYKYKKIVQYSKDEREFVRRTAFSLIAACTVHDKSASDEQFLKFLQLIKKYATDDRNFVKKAVNWALRQIGKRNRKLHTAAMKTAEDILRIDSPSARWIARDALRELKSEGVIKRMRQKG